MILKARPYLNYFLATLTDVSVQNGEHSFEKKYKILSEASIADFHEPKVPTRLSLAPYSPSSLYPMDQISPDTSFDHLDDLNERSS